MQRDLAACCPDFPGMLLRIQPISPGLCRACPGICVCILVFLFASGYTCILHSYLMNLLTVLWDREWKEKQKEGGWMKRWRRVVLNACPCHSSQILFCTKLWKTYKRSITANLNFLTVPMSPWIHSSFPFFVGGASQEPNLLSWKCSACQCSELAG